MNNTCKRVHFYMAINFEHRKRSGDFLSSFSFEEAVSQSLVHLVWHCQILSPLLILELNRKLPKLLSVNDKNTASGMTNVAFQALYVKLKTAEMNFAKLSGWTVFKDSIAIRFKLVQFCPSVTSCVFAVLFTASFSVVSGYVLSSHLLN